MHDVQSHHKRLLALHVQGSTVTRDIDCLVTFAESISCHASSRDGVDGVLTWSLLDMHSHPSNLTSPSPHQCLILATRVHSVHYTLT